MMAENMIFIFLKNILISTFQLLAEMAPYLVFGFLCAGLLNEFISTEKIARHLGVNSLKSVIKAAVFGIPLPLCSCGVIPPTMTLRKNGASRGAVLSFLIATPTTGVDSILATLSLLGPFFAVYRVVASFAASVFTGITANIFDREKSDGHIHPVQSQIVPYKLPLSQKILNIFHYAFIELLGEIGKWLVIGLLLGGIITYSIPDNFFSDHLTSGWQSMLALLLIGIPLYVCATGSIPIAAALLMKGINPGAVFVFLLAGPATNAVTITVIWKYLGKKTTFIYLVSLIVSSLSLGFLLDFLWNKFALQGHFMHHMSHKMLPGWLEITSALVIIGFLVINFISRRLPKKSGQSKEASEMVSNINIPDMTCNHCVMTVKNALKAIPGIETVDINIDTKKAQIQHDRSVEPQKLLDIIKQAGYTPDLIP